MTSIFLSIVGIPDLLSVILRLFYQKRSIYATMRSPAERAWRA